VWKQFTIAIHFNGCVCYVIASAHDTVADLKRRMRSMLPALSRCSSEALRLSTVPLTSADDAALPGVFLTDNLRLAACNIVHYTQLYACSPSTSSLMLISSPPEREHLDAPASSVAVGAVAGSLVVVVHAAEGAFSRTFSFPGLGPSRISVFDLKKLIAKALGIPPAMQSISLEHCPALHDQYEVESLAGPMQCYTLHPEYIFIRLQLIDGREVIEQVWLFTALRLCSLLADACIFQVSAMFTETILSLKQKVCSKLNSTAQDVALLFRDFPSVRMRDDHKLGNFQLYLCAHPSTVTRCCAASVAPLSLLTPGLREVRFGFRLRTAFRR
jgi:hypothetical protein